MNTAHNQLQAEKLWLEQYMTVNHKWQMVLPDADFDLHSEINLNRGSVAASSLTPASLAHSELK